MMTDETLEKEQRIRDPIHDFITFDDDDNDNEIDKILWGLVQTEPFQRLRRIKQLGFSDVVYPSATHTRFAHSLGALHIAKKMVRAVNKKWESDKRKVKKEIETTLIAALLHDIGHGPFSHAFENACRDIPDIREALVEGTDEEKVLPEKQKIHEAMTARIIKETEEIKELIEKDDEYKVDNVIKNVMAKSESVYSVVVSSQFDADRLDYMQRDRYMTGTQQSAIDFGWLIDNLSVVSAYRGTGDDEVEVKTFALDKKAVVATEAYIISLLQLYPTVYFHKTTRGAEILFSKLLKELFTDIRENRKYHGLSKQHPLVQFAEEPECLDNYLGLDDTTIWGALPILQKSGEGFVQEAADRLLTRKFYKAHDVFQDFEQRVVKWMKKNDIKENNKEDIRSIFMKKFKEHLKDAANEFENEIFFDAGERSPYKKYKVDSSNEDSEINSSIQAIVGKKKNGKYDVKNIEDVSEIIRIAPTFYFMRVYLPERDEEKVKSLIDGAFSATEEMLEGNIKKQSTAPKIAKKRIGKPFKKPRK